MFKFKFLCRWILNGQKRLVKQRQFFGWRDYEPYDNRIRKVENDLNDLYDKVQGKLDTLAELRAEHNRLARTVKENPDSAVDVGNSFYEKLNLRKVKVLPETDSRWLAFERVFTQARNVADAIKGSGFFSAGATHHADSLDFGEKGPNVVSSSMEIARRSQNNNQKKQRNNGQNQQNN